MQDVSDVKAALRERPPMKLTHAYAFGHRTSRLSTLGGEGQRQEAESSFVQVLWPSPSPGLRLRFLDIFSSSVVLIVLGLLRFRVAAYMAPERRRRLAQLDQVAAHGTLERLRKRFQAVGLLSRPFSR